MIPHFKTDPVDRNAAISNAHKKCIKSRTAIWIYLNGSGSGNPFQIYQDFYMSFTDLFDLSYDEEKFGKTIKEDMDKWMSNLPYALNKKALQQKLRDGLDLFREYETALYTVMLFKG